ncbi:PREDICTED: venom acid phosphatase Acph-1-like [Polistes dominula]|uniref:acid phosphatase n=1 Tax=Polistes dominula TaxID=743375 RepID=A0ABM1IIE5_POLDO|nr:PREDICTED: venom acid phosphatase Acph-1-like [Polistes dominula]
MIFNLDKIRYSIVLLISVTFGFIYAYEDDNYQLKLLNVLFRHGDRTPDDYETYPNDPYLNYTYYPIGNGQLTNDGKLREFRLGEFLRKRYDNYLGSLYIPKTIEARSSDYDRTKVSLQLVLAGLFPTKNVQIWNDNLLWQPIPTKYVPRVYDNLFLTHECPRFSDELKTILEYTEIKEELASFDDLNIELSKYTGRNVHNPIDYGFIYTILILQKSMGFLLPAWTKSLLPKLYDAALFGPMLKEFIQNIVGYLNGTIEVDNKLFLYSGHDLNVASLLYSLNICEPHIPEYSSSIFMELLYKDGIYYVRILYYLGIPAELKVLRLPNCEEICPLNTFFQLIIDNLPTDEDMICDKRNTSKYVDQKYDYTIKI